MSSNSPSAGHKLEDECRMIRVSQISEVTVQTVTVCIQQNSQLKYKTKVEQLTLLSQ